jgi:outer membrane protein TolC
MHGFENVRQELDSKRQQLEQELRSAQDRVAGIRADLERVHEALEALIGSKKKSKGRSRPGKRPAMTVLELQRLIARVREESPFANAKELQKAVRSLVRESGGSLTRFPTLFAEALVSSPGYSASAGHAATTNPLLGSHSEPFAHEERSSGDASLGEHAHTAHENPEGAPSADSDERPFTA